MNTENAIAVIGMSLRVPGANTLEEFWENLQAGEVSFVDISEESLVNEGIDPDFYQNKDYVKRASQLDGIDLFDAAFFDIPASEALVLDPQHRVFLEGCWQALEGSGYSNKRLEHSIGVFAGASMNSYWMRNLAAQPEYATSLSGFQSLLGNEKDYLATRVAYKLNLHGPAITVQTACSTSLVSLHMACQNLILGECDMAFAGGVSIKIPHQAGYLAHEGLPFSASGACKVFDKQGDGTIFGSGMGVVLLKPLEQAQKDRDPIHAIILGSAYNNDGNRKVGFTAPSAAGQEEALRRALAFADVDPSTISYIETHGTGTNLGDPIEIEGIQAAYGLKEGLPCALGAVKANLGHLETAAGITGLIKTITMLEKRTLPPQPGFGELNPHIDLNDSRYYISAKPQAWKNDDGPLRAAVSSFGMGGTNVHVILQEAPPSPSINTKNEKSNNLDPTQNIFVLSAKSENALISITENLSAYMKQNPNQDLRSLTNTLQLHKETFEFKRAFIANSVPAAINLTLDNPENILGMRSRENSQIVYLFSGAGTQFPGMGRDLHSKFEVFRDALNQIAQLFSGTKQENIQNLLTYLLFDIENKTPEEIEQAAEEMQQAEIMFCALFTMQYAMAKLFLSWNIKPSALLGHSHGEYVCAVLAGTLSLDDAIRLVAKRARLIASVGDGQMLLAPENHSVIRSYINGSGVSIATINSTRNTVVSGKSIDIAQFKAKIEKVCNLEAKILHVRSPLHSDLLNTVYDEFLNEVQACKLNAPSLPWVSSITGEQVENEVCTAEYWANHMVKTVNFEKASESLAEMFPGCLCLDMGPNRVVSELFRENTRERELTVIASSTAARHQKNAELCLQEALARLFVSGYTFDWQAFDAHKSTIPVQHLPTYAFDRQSYWVNAPGKSASSGALNASEQLEIALRQTEQQLADRDQKSANGRPALMVPFIAPDNEIESRIQSLWQRFFGFSKIGMLDNFIELGGTSLLATEVNDAIKKEVNIDLKLARFLELGNIREISNEVEDLKKIQDEKLQMEILSKLEICNTKETV